MNHRISIAIPTYNRSRYLRRTLDSLSGVAVPGGVDAELLVINNRCTDDTSAAVAEFAARAPFAVREVVEPEAGLNFARNRALAAAAFEYVVFFDDDVRIAPDWLRGFLEAVDALRADAVVGPVTPDFEGETPNYLSPAVLNSISSPYSRKGDRLIRLSRETAHEIPGCNFGVLKQMAIELGGFKPGLDRKGDGLVSGGDTEFGWRLAGSGKCVAYQPSCSVAHLISREKMGRDYLRRRWYGTGVTVRILGASPAARTPPIRRARALLNIARQFAAAAALRVFGQPARSFECELKARQALGYYRGR